MKKQSELTKKVLLSVMAAGLLTTCGMGTASAYVRHYDEVKYNDQTVSKGEVTTTGYMEIFSGGGSATNTKFTGNVNVSDGPNGGAFYLYDLRKQNTFSVTGGEFTNNGVKNQASVTSLKIGSGAFGGAVMNKGTVLTLKDVAINNNYADANGVIGAGGALFIDAIANTYNNQPVFYSAVTNVEITKNTSYTGNEVRNAKEGFFVNSYGALLQTGGGFAYIDRTGELNFKVADSATLTIGDSSSNDLKDSIASSIPLTEADEVKHAVLTKDGAGTLVMNGGLNKYYGTLAVKAGIMTINSDWTAHNSITVAKGATLNLADITLDSFGGDTEIEYTSTDGKTYKSAEIEYTDTDGKTKKKTKVALINGSITTETGSMLTAKDITVKAGSVNAAGTVTADNVTAAEGTTVTFSGDTTINKDLTANNTAITLNGDKAVYTIGGKIVTTGDDGKVVLSAGTLTKDDIKSSTGKLELTGTGTLSTKSDQIYTNAASATAKESGDIVNTNIIFNGGTLDLTDTQYTMSYAGDAQKKLKAAGNQSTTILHMSGNVVDETGTENNSVSIDTITENISTEDAKNVELDKVEAVVENNLLIGTTTKVTTTDSTVDGVKIEKQVESLPGVASLAITEKANTTAGVVITNKQDVTLGGSEGGALVSVVNKEGTALEKQPKVKVVVGTETAVASDVEAKGTLNVGNSKATSGTSYSLEGDLVVNKESVINVKGQFNVSDSVTLKGATANVAEGATLETKDVTLTEGTVDAADGGKLKVTNTLNVTGTSSLTGAAEATAVTVASNQVLNVGTEKKAGELKVGTLSGGSVFLDPAWKENGTIEEASGLAVETIGEDGITTELIAGHNSKISLGTKDLTDAETAFAKTGETWGDSGILAAVYVADHVKLGTGGSIEADGTKKTYTATTTQVTFGKQSMLMVNGEKVTGDEAAISGVTATSIDEGSKLYIDNAKKGETYKILASESQGVTQKWEDDKVISSNALLVFKADTDIEATEEEQQQVAETTKNSYLNYTTSVQSVKDAYEGAVIAPNVFDAAANGEGDATDFVMDKAADYSVNATKAAQVSALNSAAAMTELAGTAHGTYAVNNLFTDAVVDHMTLANERTHDKDVWAKFIHSEEDIGGLGLAGMGAGYDAQYNGIVVGADLYKGGKSTVGLALTYADGNISGNTLAAHTKNDAKYYGASVYGGIENGDSALLGDITYLHGKNDITQLNSTETITGSVKTDAFSIGIRGEEKIKAGEGQLVPYIGLRYMHLSNGSYTNSLGMAYDGDDLNLWLLPVGVKYSVDFKSKNWTVRPVAEVGYVWNMGDRDGRETVRLGTASDSFGYDVTDSGSYIARLAVEAEKDNTTFGIGYEYQKGDTVKANRWTASVNYRF